ncbi:MAG: hypothetical protein K0Q66_2224 [Chitinophagaceae bacterium]|nr:hypothetical protein [Chitinophagaceae bacterium]
MDRKTDDRLESANEPRDHETQPAPTTSTTADNPSVYKQPSIEEATTTGMVDKIDEGSEEDRKHTP